MVANSTPVEPPVAPGPAPNAWADWAGMAASIGCAIHCVATPLLLASLPGLGLAWLADEGFHRWMAVICLVLAVGAFAPGWRRHRTLLPAMLGGAGVAALLVASLVLEDGCCGGSDTGPANLTKGDNGCTACQAVDGDCPAAPPASERVLAGLPVTSLGGLLLISAHAINHRRSCACGRGGCCDGAAV